MSKLRDYRVGYDRDRHSSVTRLSHPETSRTRSFRRFSGLACGSLLGLTSVTALNGCLVAEPPDQANSVTPPVLDLTQAFPLVTQIATLRANEEWTFGVGVRSEDQGDRLVGVLTPDFSLDTERESLFKDIAPSTFDDTSRQLRIPWRVPDNMTGCHQVTLRVTHASNLRFDGGPVFLSPRDIGMATWWVNVNPDEANPDDLGTCPKPKTPS